MARVNVLSVIVMDNPCSFNNPFQFEITFESYEDLKDDLEWKVIYVGSAEDESHDQFLDSVLVGPVSSGCHKFLFQTPAPNSSKIPENDALGVTVILITCSYRTKEFVRIGYYVNNEYVDSELKENPPTIPDFTKMQRNILASSPRVTKFPIDWGDTLVQEVSNDKNPSQEDPSPEQTPHFHNQINGKENIVSNGNDNRSKNKNGDALSCVSSSSNESLHQIISDNSMEII